MAVKRYSMFIVDGMLGASEARLKNHPVFNPNSVALSDFFSVDCQRVGGGGQGWKGASWVMEPLGLGGISFQLFTQEVIQGLSMQHNTGDANCQIATYVEDEFPEGSSPLEQFELALADVVKKPEALEVVPTDPLGDAIPRQRGWFGRALAALKWFFIEDLDWND